MGKNNQQPCIDEVIQGKRKFTSRRPLAGRSFADCYPELLAEWDYQKNDPYTPDLFCPSSGYRVHWRCSHGHEWATAIANRAHGRCCPYCTHTIIDPSINSFAVEHPELAALWDYEKNDTQPSEYSSSAEDSVYWKCSNGHTWRRQICGMVRHYTGCPKCLSSRLPVDSEEFGVKYIELAKEGQSLADLYPELATTWHPTKNGAITPSMVKAGSSFRAWWRCSENHVWQQTIVQRCNNLNCPICSHQVFRSGWNDFATVNPEAASLWDYDKNTDLPSDYSATSPVKKYWKCPHGHTWQASIGHVNRGHGCVECYKSNKTSFPEQAVAFYIEQSYDGHVRGNAQIGSYIVDVLLQEDSIIIEYDGQNWHDGYYPRLRDDERNAFLQAQGYQIFHIKEQSITDKVRVEGRNIIFYNPCRQYFYLNGAILKLIELLPHDSSYIPDIDIQRDTPQILARYKRHFESNTLAAQFPESAQYWDYEANYPLTPDMITPHNSRTVHWRCPQGHTWSRAVALQVKAKHQCLQCSEWYQKRQH